MIEEIKVKNKIIELLQSNKYEVKKNADGYKFGEFDIIHSLGSEVVRFKSKQILHYKNSIDGVKEACINVYNSQLHKAFIDNSQELFQEVMEL